MATAPAADQLTLLDVAELDSQIARLERSNVKHPLREKLGTIMNAAAARARDKEAAEKQLEEKMDRWVYLNDLAERIEAQKNNG